jgi:hypothetical protein
VTLWPALREVLFRLRLYPGVRVDCSPDFCSCRLDKEGEFTRVYRCDINSQHPLAEWLFEECEGAWAVRMARPMHYRRPYLAFARPSDAFVFRLLQTVESKTPTTELS